MKSQESYSILSNQPLHAETRPRRHQPINCLPIFDLVQFCTSFLHCCGIVCILSLLCYSASSASDIDDVPNEGIFTSNIDLQRLLGTEEEIIVELQEYIHNEERRLEKLRRY